MASSISHQERLVHVALRGGDVGVNSVHELLKPWPDPLLWSPSQGLQSGTADDRDIVIRGTRTQTEARGSPSSTSSMSSSSSTMSHLFRDDEDVGNANLTGEQDVLAGLGHRAVGGGDNEDSAVHLGSTGNHVLNVVGVARAVNVSIVTLIGLVLDVSNGDRDATLALLGSLVDVSRRR